MATDRLVSVVLPVYNGERHLAGAIESICRQSYTELELIIVDDGSEDSSVRVARSYSDPRIRLLCRSHEGLAAALNAGISEARGELVARIDSDDRALPHRIRRQLDVMTQNPEFAVVGSGIRTITSGDRKISDYVFPTNDTDLKKALRRISNPFPHSTVMFRRKIVLACGGYRIDFARAQDFDLYLRLSSKHEFSSIPEVLCEVRVLPESLSATEHGGSQDECAILAFICHLVRERGLPDPLSGTGKELFLERFRTWYMKSGYPKASVSRKMRKAMRGQIADRQLAAAFISLIASLRHDPSWPVNSLLGGPSHAAWEAEEWAATLMTGA